MCSPSLLREPEREGRLRLVTLAGPQNRRRKVRAIRRVRKMPRLETQTGAAPIDVTRFAGDRTVEKISRVELHARFGGRYVQRSAAGRIHYARRVRSVPLVPFSTTL